MMSKRQEFNYDLKPCPYCGWHGSEVENDAMYPTHVRIYCIHCARATNWYHKRKQAYEAWNLGKIYREKPFTRDGEIVNLNIRQAIDCIEHCIERNRPELSYIWGKIEEWHWLYETIEG